MCKFTTRPEGGNNAQRSPMRFMGLGKMLALMLVFFAGMNLSAVAQVAQNAMPAQSVKTCSIAKGGNNISLTVKGNMPQTAKVTATQVQRTAPNGKQALGAYDITITNGKKVWQPASGQPVMVSISDPDFTDGELLDVYHEGANGLEFVATVSPENGKITFPAKSFSVYIVTKSGAGARLKVNFHQIDGSIVPIYVKAADATDAETYKTVLYDPGVGTIADGVQFRGWTQEENYDVEDADNGMTIAQVRTLVQPMLANVTDGSSIDLYPMLFKLYHVTYLDELGAVLTSKEVLFLLNSDEGYHECEINHYYEPATSEQHFLGWDVADGEEHIQNYVDDTHYQNGTSININGNIKLRAYVPYGHWLVFKENGAGASFTTAQFIENGQNTVEPTDPARFGYTFGGWYTDAACTDGNKYEFGHPITENTNLYAKWTENTTANYTVIIWKQNVHDSKNATDATKTYDFAESFSFTGTVGQVISTVTAQGTGNGRYASVNGNSIQYAGFHLNKFDENVTIVTEGNSVVNVYYDRNLITLTFQYRNNNQWATQATMTGLYGSSLTENNYTWPTNRWWYDDYNYTYGGYSGSGTRTTFLDAFLLSDDGDSQTYYGFTGDGNRTVHFMKQNESGVYTEANTVSTGQGTFNISDKYNGYKAVQYSTNNTTWTNLGEKDDEGYYGQVSNYTNLYIRYAPLLYNILYEDGVFVDGNGNAVEDVTPSSNLKTVYDVPFESSIASYNKGGANYFEPLMPGFAFEGWYVDDACTQPYTFTNMPEGITVYAKWIQIQYRVFFHPNAVDPVTGENDPSFDWPEGQAFNFRVDYNEHVSTPHANRDDYTLVGWYTDEACTQVFNGEMIALNEQTVTAEYDKTVDMTDPVDDYGNIPTTGAENHDVDRFWINNKLDLYAKWRSKLEGAKGIQIKYVFIDEDVNVILVQQEEDIFNDNVTTFSIPAPTSFEGMPNPQDSVFFQWVIQHWDGSAGTNGDFVDSDVTVYPGSPYSVNKADAQRTDNPDYDPENPTAQDQYVYTIQVRAEYIPVEKVTPTFIVWYNNYENADPDTLRQDGKLNATDPHANLFINQAVGIPTPAERAGYKFLGWYKANISSQAEVDPVMDVTEPNFLFYNEEDGKYYAEAAFTNKADSVAADEANPYDYLYAVWEQTCAIPEVTVQEVTVCEGETATLQATVTNAQDGVTYTYQWYNAYPVEPVVITGAISETLSSDTTGFFGVIVSAGENCESEMATAKVTVNLKPVAYLSVPTDADALCPNQGSYKVEADREGGKAPFTLTWTGATASEENPYIAYVAQQGTSDCNPDGTTYTVSLVITDSNNCSSDPVEKSFTVKMPENATITFSEVPTSSEVTCVADAIAPNADGSEIEMPVATDACGNELEIKGMNRIANINENTCAGEIQYVYRYEDCAGNFDTWTYTYTVTGPEAPTLVVYDTVAKPVENCLYLIPQVRYTATSACGGNVTVTQTSSPVAVTIEQTNEEQTVTITLTATDECGNTTTATTEVIIPAKPEVTLTASSDKVCEGGNVTLTVEPAGESYTYMWYGDGPQNQNPITVENLTEDKTFHVSVGLGNGCFAELEKTVTVGASFTVEIAAEIESVCYGGTAWLNALTNPADQGENAGKYTYKWNDEQETSTYNLTVEGLTQTTTFTVTVTDDKGCAVEASKEITVNPMAEVTIEGAGEICAGEEATLTATLSEEEANNVTYQWYIVNADLTETEIDGATDATYKTTQFGTYKVIVTYNTVCTAWATATLTPNPDVTPEIEISKKEQTIVYGNEIEDVTVTSNTEITFEPTPVPEGFAFEDGVLTSNLPEVGTYDFYVTAESPCGKKSDTIKVIVTPKTLTITGDFTKTYDGELFVVNATELTYTGLVGDDEITEGTVTSEDYVYGTYKCTDGQFLRTMEDMAAIQAGFGPAEVTKNYTPSFNVTLNIDKKAITVTAASDEKVYDGEPLVNGEYTIDELAEGDEATVTVEGSITCVGEADNTPVVSAIVRTVDEDRDVMDSYEITLVKGKLVVTPVENALECATEETVIEMKDCELTKVVTVEDLTSTPTVTGIDEAHYTLVNNLDELNPMSEGVYEIVWTLTDDCGNAMATCTQSVKLQYGACEGINGYEAVRIGSQCWMKENLKDEVGTYKAYKEDDANLEKFGYLYTWYTAMGLDEGDDSTDPWADAPTDACGNPYVQGICPDGWAVGSDADYALLGATAGDASFLKDPSTEYWLPEKAGKEEGNLGFNARGGGWFNSAVNDFEDIYAAFRYWTPDMEPGSAYATSGSINYFCNVPQTVLVKKSDMMSVRCIRKVQPNE